jgi:uncharacterized MnhB-related membrane protein
MTSLLEVFDVLLAGTLIFLAWRSLTTPDLFQGVVLFIVFGLLMAVTWSRLQAPDVALAEAAIGAGVAGALFLNTLGRLRIHAESHGEEKRKATNHEPPTT